MLSETDCETIRAGKIENDGKTPENPYSSKDENSKESKGDIESCVSMNINRHSSKCDITKDISLPLDRKFFEKEHFDQKENIDAARELKLSEKDLVHIIQILRGPTNKKKIKVDEVFEIENKDKPVRKKRPEQKKQKCDNNTNDNRFASSSGVSTSKYARKTAEKIPVTSKSHPNSRIRQERKPNPTKNEKSGPKPSTENFPHSQTEANVIKKSKIRPYMLDAKSRREIRDYEQYLNRKNSMLLRKNPSCMCYEKVSAKTNKQSFEVKYISSAFVRTSDLSLAESDQASEESLSSSGVMEKFQTEPRIKNKSLFKAKGKDRDSNKEGYLGGKERELYEFFEEYPKLMSSNKQKPESHSIFEKLKGDERDLPGIYTRFVRRSKGVYKRNSEITNRSFCSTRLENEFMVNNELEDHIMGELIKEKPLNNKLLELINKNPLKLEKKFKDNVRNKKPPNKKEKIQDITITIEPKKEEMIANKKKIRMTDTKSLDRKRSKESGSTQTTKKISVKKQPKKSFKNSQVKVNVSDHIIDKSYEQKTSPAILNNDPIKENLNMSPTTAITMMVLAADKVLAGKTEFFGKIKAENESKS